MTTITDGVNRCARDNGRPPCLPCLPFDNMRVRSSVNRWLIVLAELGPTLMKQSNAAKRSISNWITKAIVNNGIELAIVMNGMLGIELNCMIDPCIMRSKDEISTGVATRGLNAVNDVRV